MFGDLRPLFPIPPTPSNFDGLEHGVGFVHGLLVFRSWVAVGDETCTGLNVDLAAAYDHGSQGDAGVHVTNKGQAQRLTDSENLEMKQRCQESLLHN